MKTATRICGALFLCVSALPVNVVRAAGSTAGRQLLEADSSWKFTVGDPTGAEGTSFADASWRTVDLPHDWSIEGAPDAKNKTGAGGGYFPAGIGWYRKTFLAPAKWKGKHITVEFDGVASNATVFLNGERLGIHPYAYTSFDFDLTPKLEFGKTNVLAVRVDCSEQPSSRWYSGSGIYRHVRVIVTDETHLAPQRIFVTTPEVSSDSARVVVSAKVANEKSEPEETVVETTLLDRSGKKVGSSLEKLTIAAAGEADAKQEFIVVDPSLWSPESPVMYRAISRVFVSGKAVDEVETPFGIRSLAWSTEGFLLNGKPVKFAGGSVHHDNGLLGASAFDRAEARKVELLKAAGFNAVRTAHNPPSPAFLDACDRLGLLVLEDAFDVWSAPKVRYDYARFFDQWWTPDIDSMVRRDRNHPSIVFWGIGNEIQLAWTSAGAPIAEKLAARIRSIDSTRPLIEAFPGATYTPSTDAVFSVLDVGGYNYNLVQNSGKDHERVPSRLMMTTESLPATAFQQWQLVHDRPYILGEFVWTAMDYLGESGIGSWSYATPEQAKQAAGIATMMAGAMANMGADGKNPFPVTGGGESTPNPIMSLLFPGFPWHAADCGDLDLTGYRKPQSYYRDILWNGGDRVYATVRLPEPEGKKIVAIGWAVDPTYSTWNWPGQEGKTLQVEVYSSAEQVRLFLNEALIGEKPTGKAEEFKTTFDVPYAPGKLRVEGLRGGRVVAKQEIQTAGAATKLTLTADRTTISADGEDLAFVVVEAVDAQGRLQSDAEQLVRFTIEGPGRIAGLGNGDGKSAGSYQGDTLTLFNGRALVIVRSSNNSGNIKVAGTAEGLKSDSVTIKSHAAPASAKLK